MYSKHFRWLSILSLWAILSFDATAQTAAAPTPAAPGSTQQPGRIRATRVVGQVTAEDIVTKVITPLVNDQEITQGSIVHTAEASSVVLIFSNGASINLKDSSDLNIETFTQDPFAGNFEPSKATEEPSVSTTSIRLTRGELIGNVKKLKNGGQPGGSKFTVGTPVGAAGIRGTTFRIVYRPTGNGQAFNFSITTVEGNVEVLIATGTVTSAPVSVTENTEVVINNVTVNAATNEVSVTTAAGQTTVVTAPPPVQDAPTTTVQIVQAAALQIVQAVATAVFTPPPPTPQTNTSGGTGNTNGTPTQTETPPTETPNNNPPTNNNPPGNNNNSNNNSNNNPSGTLPGSSGQIPAGQVPKS